MLGYRILLGSPISRKIMRRAFVAKLPKPLSVLARSGYCVLELQLRIRELLLELSHLRFCFFFELLWHRATIDQLLDTSPLPLKLSTQPKERQTYLMI